MNGGGLVTWAVASTAQLLRGRHQQPVLGTVGHTLVTGLSIPITAGNRYLLVASVATTGVAVAISANGYVSGGIAIS